MEVWSSRRGGVSYDEALNHPPPEEAEEEESAGSQPMTVGNCKRFQHCVYKFFRSMGLNDEDEILFKYSSWELMEKGTGRFSLAVDYLVYRCFYSLIILGAVIYAGALKASDLGAYPAQPFVAAFVHIIYSIIYTLRIISGKQHQAKVGTTTTTDVENEAAVENNNNSWPDTSPSEEVGVKVSRRFLGSRENLADIEILQNVNSIPHPIQTPDKFVWLLFNTYAAPTLFAAILHVSELSSKSIKSRKEFFVLNLVFIGVASMLTLIELVVNCIPLRVIHGIYPMSFVMFYAPASYVFQMAGVPSSLEQINWIEKPASTFLFFWNLASLTFFVHLFLCIIAFLRNKIIFIFGKRDDIQSPLGRAHYDLLTKLIAKDLALREHLAKPTFHDDVEAEEREVARQQLERQQKEEAIKEKGTKRFLLGAKLFMDIMEGKKSEGADKGLSRRFSTAISLRDGGPSAFNIHAAYKPYSSNMTINEYIHNLTLDPKDGIPRMPKRKLSTKPDFDWVEEKQKRVKKVPISGITKEVKAKKWNEFSTPPDSLAELTKKERHKERGYDLTYGKLETYNEKLAKVQLFHHVPPPALRPTTKHSRSSLKRRSRLAIKGFELGPRPSYLLPKAIHPKIETKGPELKADRNGLPRPRDYQNNEKPEKSGKTEKRPFKTLIKKVSPTGVIIHDNWVPYVPRKPIRIPKLKYYLGDSSYMPAPKPPPPPPSRRRNSSTRSFREKRAQLENKRLEIVQSLKEKLKPTPEKEGLLKQLKAALRGQDLYFTSESQPRNEPTEPMGLPPFQSPSSHSIAGGKGTAPAHHQYIASEFIKKKAEKQRLKEAKILAKKQMLSGPHFIELKSGFSKNPHKYDYENLIKARKRKEQEEKSRRLAYEKMRKARATLPSMIVDLDNDEQPHHDHHEHSKHRSNNFDEEYHHHPHSNNNEHPGEHHSKHKNNFDED